MAFTWPLGFVRIPPEDWTHHPLESLALKYDTVEHHGWYKNLDPTVAEVTDSLSDDQILIDYSGGTGIFVDRLLHARPALQAGIVIIDASPKFLRLALEKFQDDQRVALRLIRYLKPKKRLEFVDEVLGVRTDTLVSTNAIHLYYDLPETLQAWYRVLKPGAKVFVQSGNIHNPQARPGEWIIDETVEKIHEAALEIVRAEPPYAPYRTALEDASRMEAYAALRAKYFLPVRPLSYYLHALSVAGFTLKDSRTVTIDARVDEWYDFLSVYHEGVLGWVGGSEKVEGRSPSPHAVENRLALLRQAMHRVFDREESFPCCWTYLTLTR